VTVLSSLELCSIDPAVTQGTDKKTEATQELVSRLAQTQKKLELSFCCVKIRPLGLGCGTVVSAVYHVQGPGFHL
jgi:hypothetical protein